MANLSDDLYLTIQNHLGEEINSGPFRTSGLAEIGYVFVSAQKNVGSIVDVVVFKKNENGQLIRVGMIDSATKKMKLD